VQLSLVSGPVPVAVTIAAFASLVFVLAEPGGRRWRQTAGLAAASLGIVVAIGTAVGIEHRVGSTFPQTFFVWAALPLFALAVAVHRWRDWRWTRRAVGVGSVLLLVAFGADSVNEHYAYLPTVGDAIGRPVEDQVPTRAVTATVRPALASTRHGVVVSVEIPGVVSHFRARDALVWLPPAYFSASRPTLPVVEMIAGVPGDPSNLLRAGHAGRVADAYAAGHAGVAPILVFPDQNGSFLGDTECVDGPRGNAETYLTVDVPRYLADHFHASTLGRTWGIAGYSEGGTCAVTLALRHPDRFAAFLDMAGDAHPNAADGAAERRLTIARLYGGAVGQYDAHDPATLLRHAIPDPPAALFAVGRDDRRAVVSAVHLAAIAREQHVAATVHIGAGGHTFAFVHRSLVDLFPLLADDVVRAAAGSSVA